MPSTSTAVLFGIDYRDEKGAFAHIQAADIKSFQGGKSFVAEYIGGAAGQGNAALTAADASALVAQGLSIVSIYENRPPGQPGMSDTDPSGNYTSAWVDYFQPGQGTTDAQNAISGASSAGQLTGAIYFAIDLDPAKSTDPTTGLNRISEATALNQVDEYFREISAYFNSYNQQRGTSYQIGVYGAGDVLATIVADPLVNVGGTPAFTWLAAPTSWPGYNTFMAWDIKQYDNDQFQLDGRNVDLDQTSGGPFGQWGIAAQVCSERIEQIHRESAEQFKVKP
jgi:glycoside hydrolase-like protein